MAKTIWKFEVPLEAELSVVMPEGAQVLSVQSQGGVPCIWAVVDPGAKKVPRRFQWRGTGHPLGEVGEYVGTAQFQGGALVFHLFEG